MILFEKLAVIYNIARPVLDIAFLTFIIYKGYGLIVKTQGAEILKALIMTAIAYGLALFLNLQTVLWIFNMLAPGFLIAFAIVFQPELRKIFLHLGQTAWLKPGDRYKKGYVEGIIIAAEVLSEQKRGMLCVLERSISLREIIDGGTKLNADISSGLIVSIFGSDTPLHDGAIVLQSGKIVAAGCFLPLSERQDIKKSFGTRHRAALGLAEKTDAVTLIVSEETGALSLAYDSKLFYDLDTKTISKMLEQLLRIKAEATSQGGTLNENASAD